MTKNKKLILFGTSAFAEVAYWYFTYDSEYEVIAFCADREYCQSKEVLGLPLIPFEEIEKHYLPNQVDMHITIGYTKLNQLRQDAYNRAKAKGYKLANFVDSRIRLWPNNKFGDNVFIFEDNTIQPFAEFGSNIVLWSGNHIGHHAKIGSHTFITSHVVVSGFVEIGENCFLGVNATLRDSIKVGSRAVIGAGTLILKDVLDEQIYIGPKTEAIDKNSKDLKKL